MTDTGVQRFLLKRLETLNDVCEAGEEIIYFNSKNKPENISHENVAFDRSKFMDKAGNYGWLDVTFFPFRHTQAELGKTGKNKWQGFLQINVCCPKGVGVKYPVDDPPKIAGRYTCLIPISIPVDFNNQLYNFNIESLILHRLV